VVSIVGDKATKAAESIGLDLIEEPYFEVGPKSSQSS
jgi:hypothetical protein